MKAKIAALLGTACLIAAATAHAGENSTSVIKVTTSTKATKGGTKAKPVPFAATFGYTEANENGGRPVVPATIGLKWSNVVFNLSGFPTCTAEQIDAAQSDSVCPKDSLIFEGPVGALIGPTGQPTSNVDCQGKSTRLYNSGANKISLFLMGSGAKCAGLGYTPPIPITVKTSSGASTLTVLVPESVRHPLPGVDGSVTRWAGKFIQRTRKVKGKTVYLVASAGCKSKRTFTLTIKDDEGTHPTTIDAGKCLA